jgi:SprT protein
MIDMQLQRQVEDKVLEVLELAQVKFNRVFDVPKISYNLRGGSIAGRASYHDHEIMINAEFLSVYPVEVLARTVPHEIVHLVTQIVYPYCKQHHGPEFKATAIKLKCAPERCHRMTLPEYKPHVYVCSCSKYHLSNILHKRIQHGQKRFCKKCGTIIIHLRTIDPREERRVEIV